MSTLTKFIIYQCDTCKRETEIMIDGNRPDPVRCNITHKCRGRLSRVGQSSIKKFLFTPPVIGLQDYVPRGTSVSNSHSVTEETMISLFTAGGSGMLTMFLPKRTDSGSSHTFSVIDKDGNVVVLETDPNSINLPNLSANLVLFKISPNLFQFKKYTYQVSGNVQVIRGLDDSLSSSSLRFTSSNKLRLFINGVELDPQYYDRTVNDQITFTPAIYETNNVIDVLVYNDLSVAASSSEIIRLKFEVLNTADQTDLSLLAVNSWGDSCSVKYNNDERYLLHCKDISKLTPDFSYGISGVEITNGLITKTVLPSEFGLLLGSSPYSTHDKELYSFLGGSKLLNGSNVLSYGQDESTGLTELRVVESTLTQLTRPLIPARKIELTSVESSALVSQNKLEHQYILGPV